MTVIDPCSARSGRGQPTTHDLLGVLRVARARLSVNAVAWHRKHHLEHHPRIFEACDNASCVADRKVLAAIDAALESE